MSVKNTLGGFFFIGTKFYTYEDDNEEPTIYRLIRYKESKKLYSLKNIETKEIIRVNEEELVGKYSKYTRLNHDALMSFSIVEMPDKMIKDVVICIHPENENINSYPACICRQCEEDLFINKTSVYNGRNFSVGISVTKDTCPSNVNYALFLTANIVKYMVATAVYMDDSMSDFEEYIFNGINIKKFDSILFNTSSYMRNNNPKLLGLCTSVKELMDTNFFIRDFRSVFNIKDLDIEIRDNQEFLLGEDLEKFEKLVGEKIQKTFIVKYSKYFSLSSLKVEYELIYPTLENKSNNIYVIGYVTEETRSFGSLDGRYLLDNLF